MDPQGKKQFKTGVRWLIWSGALAILSVGGWLVYTQLESRSAEPIAVRIIKVKRDNVETTINESGIVELLSQQTLTSPEEGAVEQVLVSVGDRVPRSKPLITLRNPEQQTSLTAKQLEIKNQELTLERNRQKLAEAQEKLVVAQQALLNGKLVAIQKQELTLERNREKLVEAQEKLAAEQLELEELETLDEKGFIPKNELRTQQESLRSAQSALRDAQSTVATDLLELQNLKQQRLDEEKEIRNQVLEAQAAVKNAQLELRTDQGSLKRLKLELQKIEQQLQNNVVSAPIDGSILQIMVKNGDGVNRGAKLLTLGDPTQELVSLRLSTLNAARVKVGQKARISVIGPNSQIYQGRVQSLSPQATNSNSGESSSSSGQATVAATVLLDQPTGILIPGSQVNVEIVLERKQDVLALSTEAIVHSAPKPFVWVRDEDSNAQKKPVTLGLEGLTSVEITSGVKAGEQVLLPPPESSLEPGIPVIPQEDPSASSSTPIIK
ncbi:MAG: efflux RND transporter periplasmic adaptor subunit [Symploca sp. SIO3C6]|nr:efflux RND transporter periplasmic adaptor subunit [Symploca sp. SIO3C6]